MWRFSYFAVAQRIALRVLDDPDPARNGLFFLVGDHLGSTSAVLDETGQTVGEQLYKAWGEVRYEDGWGTTEYGFTGQREQAGIGLYYYRARWYDPGLGRFTQPDTLVPDPSNPQSMDRFSYARNNPIKYKDPSGHWECYGGDGVVDCQEWVNENLNALRKSGPWGAGIVRLFEQLDADLKNQSGGRREIKIGLTDNPNASSGIGNTIRLSLNTWRSGNGSASTKHSAPSLSHEIVHLLQGPGRYSILGEWVAYEIEFWVREELTNPKDINSLLHKLWMSSITNFPEEVLANTGEAKLILVEEFKDGGGWVWLYYQLIMNLPIDDIYIPDTIEPYIQISASYPPPSYLKPE